MTALSSSPKRRFRSVAIAAAAAGVLALAGCGGGGEEAPAEESGEMAGQSEAPAEAEGPTYTEEQLKAAIAELDVDGTTYTDLPLDGADPGALMEGMEVEPAECQELLTGPATNEAFADLSKAAGMASDSTSSVMAVGDASPEVISSFEESREASVSDCAEITVTVQGTETTGSTEAADVSVDGADSAEGAVTTITAAGTEMKSASVVATAGSVIVSTSLMNSDDVDKAGDIAAAALEAIAAQA